MNAYMVPRTESFSMVTVQRKYCFSLLIDINLIVISYLLFY